jgi:hypothetical protein
MGKKIKGRAGGKARAKKLTKEERTQIAKQAAITRWQRNAEGIPEAIKDGILEIGEIELDCYVLKDDRRLFHKRGLARALGMKSQGGNVFMRTIQRKGLGSVVPQELHNKLNNPIIFKPLTGDPGHGYEGTVLIDVCDAIWEAKKRGKLAPSQGALAIKAEIILRSAAKVGITALIDEATGYIKDKRKEEYRELFKEFIREECRAWEKAFPDQFFDIIYKLYNLRRVRGKNHPQFFGHFIRKYVYAPLANSNNVILDMLDERNPVVYDSGGRKYKMFQFLSDNVGLPTLNAHLWQLIGIGNAVNTKKAFDKGFERAFPKSGDQMNLFDPVNDDIV